MNIFGSVLLASVLGGFVLDNLIAGNAKMIEKATERNLYQTNLARAEMILDADKDGYTSIEEWKPAYTANHWNRLSAFNPGPPTPEEIETFLTNYDKQMG